jgi:hypothetical protein
VLLDPSGDISSATDIKEAIKFFPGFAVSLKLGLNDINIPHNVKQLPSRASSVNNRKNTHNTTARKRILQMQTEVLKAHVLNNTIETLAATELLSYVQGFMVEQSQGLVSSWAKLPLPGMFYLSQHGQKDDAFRMKVRRCFFSYHTSLNVKEEIEWLYDGKEDLYKSSGYSDLGFRNKAWRF